MKDLKPNILNDYEHLITRTIEQWGDNPDFPKMMSLDCKDLEDYLFEYQSILDSEGSQKTQLTKYGIIAVIPVIILSAFPETMLPWGKWSLIAGVVLGVLIALLLKGLMMLGVKSRISHLKSNNPQIAAFTDKVKSYHEAKKKV